MFGFAVTCYPIPEIAGCKFTAAIVNNDTAVIGVRVSISKMLN